MNAPADAPPVSAGKSAWRRWARGLPPTMAADQIRSALADFVDGIEGIVLGYVALSDEVDIAMVLDARPIDTIALPRLSADGTLTLHMDDGARERHAFGLAQPPATAASVEPSELAAVLVPGRVFDRRGYRLGRGGGHYDRLLSGLSDDVPTIGVVPADRIVDAVPTEPHDVPVTHLATESAVTRTSRV